MLLCRLYNKTFIILKNIIKLIINKNYKDSFKALLLYVLF